MRAKNPWLEILAKLIKKYSFKMNLYEAGRNIFNPDSNTWALLSVGKIGSLCLSIIAKLFKS
jgi:hypothetical protein